MCIQCLKNYGKRSVMFLYFLKLFYSITFSLILRAPMLYYTRDEPFVLYIFGRCSLTQQRALSDTLYRIQTTSIKSARERKSERAKCREYHVIQCIVTFADGKQFGKRKARLHPYTRTHPYRRPYEILYFCLPNGRIRQQAVSEAAWRSQLL